VTATARNELDVLAVLGSAAEVRAAQPDLAALRRLPRVPGGPAVIPSQQQATAAQTLVNWRWRRVLR